VPTGKSTEELRLIREELTGRVDDLIRKHCTQEG
jgi:hypothetical protein